MKNSLLDYIFSMDGEIHSLLIHNEEYKKIVELNSRIYNKLVAELDDKQQKEFIKFADNGTDCEAEASEAYFKIGFKMGVRLAAECLCD